MVDVLSTMEAGKVAQDEWHHFAVTVEEQVDLSDDVRFYLDGVEVGSVLGLTTLPDAGYKTFLLYDVNENKAFIGMLDAIRLCDESLTPDEFLNVPEPSGIVMVLAGLAVLAIGRVRRP